MKRSEIIRRINDKCNELGIPPHLREISTRHQVQVRVLIGGKPYTVAINGGAWESQVAFQLGKLEGRYLNWKNGQKDIEDALDPRRGRV